ncbi:hypothetical protein SMICM304S_01306 [Streptomyces microflavus]
MDRNIRTTDDVLTLLDSLFVPEAHRWTTDAASWWDDFYGVLLEAGAPSSWTSPTRASSRTSSGG